MWRRQRRLSRHHTELATAPALEFSHQGSIPGVITRIRSHTTALIIDQLSYLAYWNGRRLLWHLNSKERQYFPVSESRRKWRTEDRWLSGCLCSLQPPSSPGRARLTLNLATPGSLVWANKHLTRQGLRVTWHHLPSQKHLWNKVFPRLRHYLMHPYVCQHCTLFAMSLRY